MNTQQGGYAQGKHSMSNRALDAYVNNVKPFSKITARDLKIAKITESLKFVHFLKDRNVITTDEYHHTSTYFNTTDFWDVHDIAQQIKEISDEEMSKLKTEFTTKTSTETVLEWVKIDFEEWEGTRKKGKFIQNSAYGIKKGDWAHLINGGKKSLKGTHILKIQELGLRKPRAVDAEQAKKLKKTLQK